MVASINQVFRKALESDPSIVFFGEDIEDPKGGVFGLTKGLEVRRGLEMTPDGALANFPEGQAAAEVMVRSLTRVVETGRVRPVDPVLAAGQFLSATHGYVLLELAGALGAEGRGLEVIASLASNLMVGLGDSREAVEHSLVAATAFSGEAHDARVRGATPALVSGDGA